MSAYGGSAEARRTSMTVAMDLKLKYRLTGSCRFGILPCASNFVEDLLQFAQLHRRKFVTLLSGAVGCLRGLRRDV
jgi:hypothetical protein